MLPLTNLALVCVMVALIVESQANVDPPHPLGVELGAITSNVQTDVWIDRAPFQYKVSSQKLNCMIAQAQCEKELGYLAVVMNSADNDYLAGLTSSSYFGYWKKKDDPPNVWTWLDGGRYVYANWATGVPPTGLAQTECYCSFITSTKFWYSDNCVRTTPTSNYFICQRPKNFCTTTACKNGGTCVPSGNNFTCSCVPGTTGALCDNVLNYCLSNPCQNGGTCFNKLGSFDCTCEPGYTGKMCEININECDSQPCQNHGTCTDLVNNYTCTCSSDYNGTLCETFIGIVDDGSAVGPKPAQASLVPIIVPIVVVIILLIGAGVVVFIILKRRRGEGDKDYRKYHEENGRAEYPDSTEVKQPTMQLLNDIPPGDDRVHYADILPAPRAAGDTKPLLQEQPLSGHYAQLQFHDQHPSELQKAASPLPADSMAPAKPSPMPRQSTASPMEADKSKPFVRQGGRPQPQPRTLSMDSPNTTADTSMDEAPKPKGKKKKQPSRPKSVADLMEAKDQDVSDSDNSSRMGSNKPVRAQSRDALNELTLGPEDTLSNVKDRLNDILAKPDQRFVPVVHPKPILKKPTSRFPTPEETARKSADFRKKHPPGYPYTTYTSPGLAGGGINTSLV